MFRWLQSIAIFISCVDQTISTLQDIHHFLQCRPLGTDTGIHIQFLLIMALFIASGGCEMASLSLGALQEITEKHWYGVDQLP